MPLMKCRLAQLMVLTEHTQLLVQSCCLLMQVPRCSLCLHVWRKTWAQLNDRSGTHDRRWGWWSRLQALKQSAAFAAGKQDCRVAMPRLQGVTAPPAAALPACMATLFALCLCIQRKQSSRASGIRRGASGGCRRSLRCDA